MGSNNFQVGSCGVFFEEKGPRWMQWSSWGLPQGQTKMNRILFLVGESNCSHQTNKKSTEKIKI